MKSTLQGIQKKVSGMLGRNAGPVADGKAEAEPDQQLVELFNKRNELKRAYDRTVNERDQLLAEVTILRKANDEMSRKLAGLDKAMLDPVKAQSVLVHYGLQGVWRTCERQLAAAARELRLKYEQQEREKLLGEYKAQLESEIKSIDERMGQVGSIRDEMLARKKDLEEQYRTAKGFWNYFKRKKLRAELDEIRSNLEPLISRYAEHLKQIDAVRDREPPKYEGLSISARRLINLTLIAYAQYFYLHFSVDDISLMAHTSHAKLPHEVNFGNVQTCLNLQASIHKAVIGLAGDKARGERIMNRVGLLQASVKYEGSDDTIPESTSVGYISKAGTGDSSTGGLDDRIVANVLELDSWGVQVLLLK